MKTETYASCDSQLYDTECLSEISLSLPVNTLQNTDYRDAEAWIYGKKYHYML